MWRNTLRCWLALVLLSISCVAVQPQVARVPVRIIVTETQEKAEHALGELNAGADFAAVAKAESTDPTAAEGGSLGMVTPDGLRTELRSYRPNGSGMNKIIRSTSATPWSIKRSNLHLQTCDRCSDFWLLPLGSRPTRHCSGCNI